MRASFIELRFRLGRVRHRRYSLAFGGEHKFSLSLIQYRVGDQYPLDLVIAAERDATSPRIPATHEIKDLPTEPGFPRGVGQSKPPFMESLDKIRDETGWVLE